MSRFTSFLAISALALVAFGCGDDDGGSAADETTTSVAADDGSSSEVPAFGEADDTCPAVTVELGSEDEALAEALDCFMEKYEAGEAVVVDVRRLTVEGSPIFERYEFDGETITIINDTRLDAFSGGSGVIAETCESVELDGGKIVGVSCTSIEHPGLPDADG